MLWELTVIEQRYRAVLEVMAGVAVTEVAECSLAPKAELIVTGDWEFAGVGYRSALEADLAAAQRARHLPSPVAA